MIISLVVGAMETCGSVHVPDACSTGTTRPERLEITCRLDPGEDESVGDARPSCIAMDVRPAHQMNLALPVSSRVWSTQRRSIDGGLIWFPLLFMAMVGACVIILVLFGRGMAQIVQAVVRPKPGRCSCGYEVGDLAQCPECGEHNKNPAQVGGVVESEEG